MIVLINPPSLIHDFYTAYTQDDASTGSALAQKLPKQFLRPKIRHWYRLADKSNSSILIPSAIFQSSHDQFGRSTLFSAFGRMEIVLETIDETRSGFPGNDPRGDMAHDQTDCDTWPPAYLVIKPRLAAMSCAKRGRTRYYIAKYTQWGAFRFWADYDSDKADFWNPVIEKMSNSMRQVKRLETPY